MSTFAPHLGLTSAGPGTERFGLGQTPNPWYNIANQFTPRNLHDVIKWSRYITVQSPTVTEVIRKLSTYPITDFIVDTEDRVLKDKYEDIIESIMLKDKLEDAGFDHYTIGNVFLSIYFPIQRTLTCPHCKTEYNARNADFVEFKRYQFQGNCPACGNKAVFKREDRRSKNVSDINLVKWTPENVSVNHNPITGESEFYYKIPNGVRRRIMQGDRLFINSVPWGFVEAVRDSKDFKFDSDNIFHLKNLSMGNQLEGLGLPPLISFYSLVFYQAVLRKANESIATGHLSPLRTVFPQASSGNGDPVVSMSMSSFAGKVEQALKKHKQDPNHVLISPIPLGYQNLGGEGRSLMVSGEIDQAEKTMLLGLGVSMELLSGSTNWTSSTVGLRLLENTMNSYTAQIQRLITWVMRKISAYLNIERVGVEMTPFKLTDDTEQKRVLMALAQAGEGSLSTLFESMGLDYKEELERIKKDTVAKSVMELETEQETEVARFVKSKNVQSEDEDDNGFAEAKNQAYSLAEQLASMPYENRRNAMVQIMRRDEGIAQMVASLLPHYGIDPETFMSGEERHAAEQIAPGMVEEPASSSKTEKEKKEEGGDPNKDPKKKPKSDPDKAKKEGELEGPKEAQKGGRQV